MEILIQKKINKSKEVNMNFYFSMLDISDHEVENGVKKEMQIDDIYYETKI
jgi:hypothetical protein